MHYDVIGIGIAVHDMLAVVPQIPKRDEITVMLEYREDLGGPVAIALVCLSRLGLRTKFIGKIGDDRHGKLVLERLQKEGVDTSSVVIDIGASSAFAFILIDSLSRKRTIIFNPGCNLNLREDEIDLSETQEASYLHLDGGLFEVCKKASSYTKSKGIKTSLDIQVAYPELKELLKTIDVFIPPKDAARAMVPQQKRGNFGKICGELLGFGPQIVCITLGEKGCMVGNCDKITKVPSYAVDVVDTTGAGDAFHGAFLFGLVKGWEADDVAKFSNAVSAINCTEIGGREGLPDYEKVGKFLRDKGETFINEGGTKIQ